MSTFANSVIEVSSTSSDPLTLDREEGTKVDSYKETLGFGYCPQSQLCRTFEIADGHCCMINFTTHQPAALETPMISAFETFDTPSTLIGRVQWYNLSKGYGFLASPDVDGDILIHQSTLQSFGSVILSEGMKVEFELTFSDKGPRASKVFSVEMVASKLKRAEAATPEQTHPARIKWFDEDRGYGFANVFGLAEDVYVSADVFNDSGIAPLEGGQAVSLVLEARGGKLRASSLHSW